METNSSESEVEHLRFSDRLTLVGAILGYVAMVTVLGFGTYIFLHENTSSKIVGGLMNTASLTGIVRLFVLGRRSAKCDTPQDNESSSGEPSP